LPQVDTILLDSSTTPTLNLSETSKSLKINKEEVPKNLFPAGDSIRCFFTFFFLQSQIADVRLTKGLLVYSAVLAGCCNYYFGFLLLENTSKANTGF